jgi:hypothetical protein
MSPSATCGSRAIGLLPPRSLVRKARYVASGAVREFERTGGKEPLVAPRTYSKVPGRSRVPHTSETTCQGRPAPGRACATPAGPQKRTDCASCPAGSSGRAPGPAGSPGSAETGRSGATARRPSHACAGPHAGRARRGGQARHRLNRGGGGDAGQCQPQ